MKFPAGAPTDVHDEKLRGQLVHGACRESFVLPLMHWEHLNINYEYLSKVKFYTATLESYFTQIDLFFLNASFLSPFSPQNLVDVVMVHL